MDLHDFSGDKMYFDEHLAGDVKSLLDVASNDYAKGASELPLLKAYLRAPDSLTVLVALYRFYYYQHQYEEALLVADSAMSLVAMKLDFSASWEKVSIDMLGYGVMKSMTLVRFYLLCLKGAGYLNLRTGNIELGMKRLRKVIELDTEDRLGARILLQTVESFQRRVDANFGQLQMVATN